MGFTTFNRRDAQRFRKVYPRIRKTPRYFTISDQAMSVESTKVQLTNETQGEFVFQLEYETIPTVVLTVLTLVTSPSFIIPSFKVEDVEFTVVVVPSTCKSPLIIT